MRKLVTGTENAAISLIIHFSLWNAKKGYFLLKISILDKKHSDIQFDTILSESYWVRCGISWNDWSVSFLTQSEQINSQLNILRYRKNQCENHKKCLKEKEV